MVTKRECTIWIWMLCPGSARVNYRAGEQQGALLWLWRSLQPNTTQQIQLADPLSPLQLYTSWSALGRGCEALMPCQPWREQPRGNEFSVKGSSRAGASKGESHPVCKRLPKCFENDQAHHDRETTWTRTPRMNGETPTCTSMVTAGEVSQHPARAGACLQRAGNHGASVNTFISLELHQGLEAEKTVTPNQSLAQCLRLWLFKSQHIPRTVNSSVLRLERRAPQKQKWNKERGNSTTKTLKLQTGLETGQAPMTHSFCKDHQSTDLEGIIGTVQKATISFCSSAVRLQMETSPSLGNNPFKQKAGTFGIESEN